MREHFERSLISHCSPTLASLKSGSIFNIPYTTEHELVEVVNTWNKEMCAKGIQLCPLRKKNGSAMIYVYRRVRLERDLSQKGVSEFLSCYGYNVSGTDDAIERLKERIVTEDGFPHEIGIFLGYPLEDVAGFIDNGGRNSKCSGCWKVYCNEREAEKTFEKYRKCKNVYYKLWSKGRSVSRLTVKV